MELMNKLWAAAKADKRRIIILSKLKLFGGWKWKLIIHHIKLLIKC